MTQAASTGIRMPRTGSSLTRSPWAAIAPSGSFRITAAAGAPYTDSRVVRTNCSNFSGRRVRSGAWSNLTTTSLSLLTAMALSASMVSPRGMAGPNGGAVGAATTGVGATGAGVCGTSAALTGVITGVAVVVESTWGFGVLAMPLESTRVAGALSLLAPLAI